MHEAYEIISVESSAAPDNLAGTNWYRYTIGQGPNRIFGYRQGDLGSITKSIEELVERLNERRVGKVGRVHLKIPARPKSVGDK